MAFTKMKGLVKDRPKIVTVVLFCVVVLHIVLTYTGVISNTWETFLKNPDRIDVYLAAGSVAAIVAGFAGVVVTFGLTAQGRRFQTLRVRAGKSLGDNWASTSISGFAAAGLGLLAAILDASGLQQFAPWFFELALLVLVHGTMRVIWLLRELADITGLDDQETVERSTRTKISPDSFN